MLFPPSQPKIERRRVVVTGVGIITALGAGWAENADGFRSGRTAFGPVTLFDVARQRVQQAAEVCLPRELPSTRLNSRQIERLDRADRLLLHAAHEALTQAKWRPDPRITLVLGTTSGGMSLGEAYYRQAVASPRSRRRQAWRVMNYQAHRQAGNLAEAFGLEGSQYVIANACASGANAVGHAWELIRTGQCDQVLTGGYDALSQLVFAGFDSLQALSPTRCRPFAADRDGLALGEGAAVLCLENLDRARSRSAEILGELVGYGATTDIHHLTQPQPQGDAALAAMNLACQSAGLTPAEIDYLNAHGTATPLNDHAEALAINRWAGAHAASLPVSSTKSGIGHLLGAAGAVEVVVCLMALRGQWLPPNASTAAPDPICQFPLVQEPTNASLEFALTNSFGFGGANASVILRRWT